MSGAGHGHGGKEKKYNAPHIHNEVAPLRGYDPNDYQPQHNPYAFRFIGTGIYLERAFAQNKANETDQTWSSTDGAEELIRLGSRATPTAPLTPDQLLFVDFMDAKVQNKLARSKVDTSWLDRRQPVAAGGAPRNPNRAQAKMDDRKYNIGQLQAKIDRKIAKATTNGKTGKAAKLQSERDTLQSYLDDLNNPPSALAATAASRFVADPTPVLNRSIMGDAHTRVDTETAAFDVMSKYYSVEPPDVSQNAIDQRLTNAQFGDTSVAEANHIHRQHRLEEIRANLQQARYEIADDKAHLFGMLGRTAIRDYFRARRDSKRSGGVIPMPRIRNIRRDARDARQRRLEFYENSATEYYETLHAGTLNNPHVDDEVKRATMAEVSAHEQAQLRSLTNDISKNLFMAKAGNMLLNNKGKIALGALATALVCPPAAAVIASTLAAAKADNMGRGKLKHDEKWITQQARNLQGNNPATVGFQELHNQNMLDYGSDLVWERARRLAGPAVGATVYFGPASYVINHLPHLGINNPLPSINNWLQELGAATDPSKMTPAQLWRFQHGLPTGAYGSADAMDRVWGRNP